MTNYLKKFATFFFAMAVTMLVLPSCNKDNDEPGTTDYQYLIVTISTLTDTGTTFTYQNGGLTSPVITLTSSQKLNKDSFKEGDRVMIAFTYSGGNQSVTNPNSGEITLLAIAPVINGDLLTGTANEYNSFSSALVENTYCWMAGPYLNIQTSAVIRYNPKEFRLVMDQSTADQEYPTIYLLFESDDDVNGVAKNLVSSFNLTSFWENEANYKGFNLRVANLNGQREWTFTRSGHENIQPNE